MASDFKYEVIPDIKVSRYEANKKTGHVGIDENGTVEIIWAFKKRIITVDIVAVEDEFGLLVQAYTIDGHAGNNYDFIVYPGLTTYIELENIEEGQDLKIVVRNGDELSGPALLSFSACPEGIKWFNNELPEISTNAIITLYKSNNIIYAKIEKPWIGTGGSGSCGNGDSDADCINCSVINVDGGGAASEYKPCC